MKKFFPCIFLFIFLNAPSVVSAQLNQNEQYYSYVGFNNYGFIKQTDNFKEKRFKRMRVGGVAAIGVGAGLFTISTKAWQRNERRNSENQETNGDGLNDLGRAMGIGIGQVGGVALMAAGTAATIIANLKIDKLKKISISTSGNSVGVAYKF